MIRELATATLFIDELSIVGQNNTQEFQTKKDESNCKNTDYLVKYGYAVCAVG